MFVLITGEPNTGKSHIIDYLSQKGFTTFKVDDYINEIYQNGRIGYQVISEAFGPSYVNEEGVDKEALAALIIQDKKAQVKLQRLIWPLILDYLVALKASYPSMIVEMAIYKIAPHFFHGIFDFVIDVRRRPALRDINYKSPMIGLFSESCPNIHYDFVINNNWSWGYVERLVDELFHII